MNKIENFLDYGNLFPIRLNVQFLNISMIVVQKISDITWSSPVVTRGFKISLQICPKMYFLVRPSNQFKAFPVYLKELSVFTGECRGCRRIKWNSHGEWRHCCRWG